MINLMQLLCFKDDTLSIERALNANEEQIIQNGFLFSNFVLGASKSSFVSRSVCQLSVSVSVLP